MERIKAAGARVGKWLGRLAFFGSLLGFAGLVFIRSGGYDHALDWRDHRVTVQIAHDLNVKDIAANLTHEDFRQINCLALNMYFEARNQGTTGMAAVGDVVYNRLNSGVFPDQICQVIYQGTRDKLGNPVLNKCQFSWYCDGLSHRVTDKVSYARAYEVAYNQYLYRSRIPDITKGATFYHTDAIDPKHGVWKSVKPVGQIGQHIFYKKSKKNRVDPIKSATRVDRALQISYVGG